MKRAVVVLLICLAVLPILAVESFSMIRTLPIAELVRRSDYIVIGEVRRIEVVETLPSHNGTIRHLDNEVIMMKQLKGSWPPDKPMTFKTISADHWIEDNVEFPFPGTRVMLFVKKGESSRLVLVNGIQGLWPLQDGKPLRMGTGKTIDEIRAIIEAQTRQTGQKTK